ncbi:hypothetical protein K7H20_23020 [Salipiger manganoxidans]|uniref:hypothetical protein n=1 Tax=Salipiger marinus TaxID=555512 RepID=UPI001E352801|nr:hypothetical protein [Salipiger manganoxidans]MCD1620930.1 hypothetical protein [Salipiger manganoxidans]
MKFGEVIDAVFDDMPADYEDPRETEARALPGANFASVYGFTIYRQARQELAGEAARYSWSERDREAYWPTALTRAMSMHAESGRQHGVAETPSERDMETAKERSGHFLNAWKVMTGNDMQGGRLSTHKRLELAPSVPDAFRVQARELRDEGVCQFADRCLEIGAEMRNGERNRAAAQRPGTLCGGQSGGGPRPLVRQRKPQRVR